MVEPAEPRGETTHYISHYTVFDVNALTLTTCDACSPICPTTATTHEDRISLIAPSSQTNSTSGRIPPSFIFSVLYTQLSHDLEISQGRLESAVTTNGSIDPVLIIKTLTSAMRGHIGTREEGRVPERVRVIIVRSENAEWWEGPNGECLNGKARPPQIPVRILRLLSCNPEPWCRQRANEYHYYE